MDTFGRPFWPKGHMFDTPALLYTFDCTPQGGDVNLIITEYENEPGTAGIRTKLRIQYSMDGRRNTGL